MESQLINSPKYPPVILALPANEDEDVQCGRIAVSARLRRVCRCIMHMSLHTSAVRVYIRARTVCSRNECAAKKKGRVPVRYVRC